MVTFQHLLYQQIKEISSGHWKPRRRTADPTDKGIPLILFHYAGGKELLSKVHSIIASLLYPVLWFGCNCTVPYYLTGDTQCKRGPKKCRMALCQINHSAVRSRRQTTGKCRIRESIGSQRRHLHYVPWHRCRPSGKCRMPPAPCYTMYLGTSANLQESVGCYTLGTSTPARRGVNLHFWLLLHWVYPVCYTVWQLFVFSWYIWYLSHIR